MNDNKDAKRQKGIIIALLIMIIAVIIAILVVLFRKPTVEVKENVTPTQEVVEEKEEVKEEENVGGFVDAKNKKITDELKEIFEKGVESNKSFIYEPVELVATQVVSGINYKFLATGTSTTKPIVKGKYYITIYKDLEGNISLLDIEVIEEEKVETITSDITQMYFWVVFYDQYGNELQREALKYGTVPTYKNYLPSGFDRWVYKNSNITVKNFAAITGNTYFQAICKESPYTPSPKPTPTPVDNISTVSFMNNRGEILSLDLKAGTVISFDAGDGFYTTVPESITLEKDQTIDLTDPKYAAKPVFGKSFVGFSYDSANKKFVAQFMDALPEKGDIVTLNDGKEYKVIKRTGAHVQVLALDNLDTKMNFYGSSGADHRSDVFGVDGLLYSGSLIDDYLENTWYAQLADGDKLQPMHDAIVEQKKLEQSMFSVNYDGDEDLFTAHDKNKTQSSIGYGYTSAIIGDRHVYLLDVQDIYDYVGDSDVYYTSVDEIFGLADSIDDSIWLRSAHANVSELEKDYMFVISKDRHNVSTYFNNNELYVRPSFVINLAADGVDYVIKDYKPMPAKGDLITLNDGRLYRVLSTEGTTAKLLGMNDFKNNEPYSLDPDASPVTFTDKGIGGGDKSGVGYNNSNIDKLLNGNEDGDFFYSLPEYMKKAIYTRTVFQDMYKRVEGVPSGEYVLSSTNSSMVSYYLQGGYSTIEVGPRNVFALGVNDIVEYLGKDFDGSDLKEMLYATSGVSQIWLSSAISNYEKSVFVSTDTNCSLASNNAGIKVNFIAIRPVFYINLYSQDIEFEVKYDNKPIINYIDENGKLKTIKLFVGNNINFDAGDSDKGEYKEGAPSTIILGEYDNIDLTDEKYFPSAKEGYKFVGFEYDSVHQKFVAQYRVQIVQKGDLITLNDEKLYRVIDEQGETATLLAIESIALKNYWNTSENQTTFVNDKEVTKYDGSTLDTYLEGTWYKDLETKQPEIFAAIQPTEIVQKVYKDQVDPNDNTIYTLQYDFKDSHLYLEYLGDADPITRHAFALDFEDIFNYFEKDNISSEELNTLFFNKNTKFYDTAWLRSANPTSTMSAFFIDASFGCYQFYNVDIPRNVRPAFTVDLTTAGLKVEKYVPKVTMPEKGDIITLDDNQNYRVLSVDGYNAFVVGLSDAGKSKYSSTGTASFADNGIGGGAKTGVKYAGSTLDTYLETTWYNDLYAKDDTKAMHDAIQYVPINQYIYKREVSKPSDDYLVFKSGNNWYVCGYKPVSVGNRHVFSLDIDDLVKYFGDKATNHSDDEFKMLLYNTLTIDSEHRIWLRSANVEQSAQAMQIYGASGGIAGWSQGASHSVRAAFYIDLSHAGVSFEIVEE